MASVARRTNPCCGETMNNLIIRNIGRLVIMDDEKSVVTNAALWVHEGTVQWWGVDSALPSLPEGYIYEYVDARGMVVTPGLVDCHTHLVFGGDRRDEFARRLAGVSYEELAAAGGGIRSTVAKTRAASGDELRVAARGRLAEMVARGVTTAEVKSGYGLSLESELRMLEVVAALAGEQPVRLAATFLGAHTVPSEYRSVQEYTDYLVATMIPEVGSQGIAGFCDVFCERNVFDVQSARRVLEAGLRYGMRPKVHAEQLSRQGGTALGVSVGAVSVDHLEYVNEADVEALAQSNTVAVMLPGAGVMLNVAKHAPARALLDAGAKVAIATDCNPGSSMCVDLPLMTTLGCTLMEMSPDEALAGVTRMGALALGREDIGHLKPGALGDLVVWKTDHEHNLPYRFGAVQPQVVAIGGEVLSVA